jgi:NitT/TauT family transport system substrate-binding protein
MAAAIAAGLTAAACASVRAPDLERITLQLGWLKTGQQAGKFMAAEKGFYAAEGLEVGFLDGGPSISVAPIVLSGKADVGVV